MMQHIEFEWWDDNNDVIYVTADVTLVRDTIDAHNLFGDLQPYASSYLEVVNMYTVYEDGSKASLTKNCLSIIEEMARDNYNHY